MTGDLSDVEMIPTPRVAFVGVLEDWVDLELFVFTAERLPSVHFLVVGPSRVYDRRLRSIPNVHFLGRKDRFTVPGILKLCSASLVPFRKTKLTERIVPLKVFEALAAGIYPVCTDFSADLERFERDGYTLIGRSPEEFVHSVAQAVAADAPALRKRLSDHGRRQTWRARWTQMSAILEEAIVRIPSEHEQ